MTTRSTRLDTNIDPEIWGPHFRRAGIKMSARALAEASGVSNSAISSYFRGQRLPTDDSATKIGDALNMSASQVLDIMREGIARAAHTPFGDLVPPEADYLTPQERVAVLEVIRVMLDARGYKLRNVPWSLRTTVDRRDDAKPGKGSAAARSRGKSRRRSDTS